MNEITETSVWDLATTYFTPTIVLLLIIISVIYVKLERGFNALFFLSAGVFLGVAEVLSVIVTGQTISQNHWALSTEHEVTGDVLNLLIGVLFLILAVHLAKVSLKRRKRDV